MENHVYKFSWALILTCIGSLRGGLSGSFMYYTNRNHSGMDCHSAQFLLECPFTHRAVTCGTVQITARTHTKQLSHSRCSAGVMGKAAAIECKHNDKHLSAMDPAADCAAVRIAE